MFPPVSLAEYEHLWKKDTNSFSTSFGLDQSIVSTLIHVKRDKDGHSGLKFRLTWDDIRQFEPGGDLAKDKLFGEVRFEKWLGGDENHRIEVTAGASDQQVGVLLPELSGIPPTTFANEVQEAYAKANYTAGELRAQVSWTGFQSKTVPDLYYTGFDLDLDTADFDLQYSLPLMKDHDLTVGTGFRFSSFLTMNPDIAEGRHSTNLVWGFVQDEVKLADNVYLTGGLRIDRHSEVGNNVSPRIALVWEFDPGDDQDADRQGESTQGSESKKSPEQERFRGKQALRASVGKGFRNPSMRELWFEMPVDVPGLGTLILDGNKDLDAEEIRSFEVGYFGWPHERVKAGLSAYYNRIDSITEFQVTSPGSPVRVAPLNTSREKAYGIEVEAECLLNDSLSAFADYAYVKRKKRGSGPGRRIQFAPRHKINTGFRVLTGQGISGMLWMNYFDDVEFSNEKVAGYAMVNGSVSYRFFKHDDSEGRFFISAFNLLDEDHNEHPQGHRYGLILTAAFEVTF